MTVVHHYELISKAYGTGDFFVRRPSCRRVVNVANPYSFRVICVGKRSIIQVIRCGHPRGSVFVALEHHGLSLHCQHPQPRCRKNIALLASGGWGEEQDAGHNSQGQNLESARIGSDPGLFLLARHPSILRIGHQLWIRRRKLPTCPGTTCSQKVGRQASLCQYPIEGVGITPFLQPDNSRG